MRRLAYVLLAAALLAPAAPAALAAPARCAGVTDPTGDAWAPGRDITCVAVAAGRKEVVISLTLAAAPTPGDQAAMVVGDRRTVSFVVAGVTVVASHSNTATGHGVSWSLTMGQAALPFVSAAVGTSLVWRLKTADLHRPVVKVTALRAESTVLGMTDDSAR